MFRILLCLWVAFFSLSSVQAKDVVVPSLSERVTDLANVLTATQKATIEQQLQALEQSKGSQIAVLIVPTTKPESIEGYSIRVTEKWKLGRKGVDDGVLLLIAHQDRKIRIEVGYGLEGAITDLSSGRIIREFITPKFKKGNFYEGIHSGVGQLIKLINGEPLPEPTLNQDADTTDASLAIPLVFFASLFLPKFLSPLFGRNITASIVTIIGTAIVWFILHDIIITVVTFLFIALFSFGESRRENFHDSGTGSLGGGGFGDGGFGGGGGFSGGGGGFGGGGASGGW